MLQNLKKIAAIVIIIVVAFIFVSHLLAARSKFKEFKQISTREIVTIEIYEYPRGFVASSGSTLHNLTGTKLATVKSRSQISEFQQIIGSIYNSHWNRFGDKKDYGFRLWTQDSSFVFYGFQTESYPQDIWVRLDGNSGVLMPHLKQWIDKQGDQK